MTDVPNSATMLRDSPWGWTMREQTPGVFDKSRFAGCKTGCSGGPTSGPDHEPPFAPVCRDNRTGNPFPEPPLPPRPCEYDAYQTVLPVHWSLGGGVVGTSTFLRRF